MEVLQTSALPLGYGAMIDTINYTTRRYATRGTPAASLEAHHSTHTFEGWPPAAEKLARAAVTMSLHETVTSDNSEKVVLDLACGNQITQPDFLSNGAPPIHKLHRSVRKTRFASSLHCT